MKPDSTLLITRGLPASGKTTVARAWVAEDPERRARVNRDDLRAMLFDAEGVLPWGQEEVVSTAQQRAVRALLKRGISVIVDDTNLRMKYARNWATLAYEMGAEFEVVDLLTDVDECVQRDQQRAERGQRHVGEDVIRGLAAKFHGPRLPVTRYEPQATAAAPLYEPDESLPRAWIIDVDGTVALMGDRSPYDYSAVSRDLPNVAIIDVVRALHAAGDRIIYCSGREDSARADTERWLHEHVPAPHDALIMRKTGDHRNDAIVKIEMFYESIAPHYRVIGVLDDRKRVVDAWRAIGLTVMQVAEGDF